MNSPAANSRLLQLRQRCEQQRQQLNRHFVTIEMQLQAADAMVSTLRGAVKSPILWISLLTGIWAIKQSVQRSGLWSFISRGWMLWSVAGRIIKWFRKA